MFFFSICGTASASILKNIVRFLKVLDATPFPSVTLTAKTSPSPVFPRPSPPQSVSRNPLLVFATDFSPDPQRFRTRRFLLVSVCLFVCGYPV